MLIAAAWTRSYFIGLEVAASVIFLIYAYLYFTTPSSNRAKRMKYKMRLIQTLGLLVLFAVRLIRHVY
jgi:hypothetical protein